MAPHIEHQTKTQLDLEEIHFEGEEEPIHRMKVYLASPCCKRHCAGQRLAASFLLFLLQNQRSTVESTYVGCWAEFGATFLKPD